MRKKKCEDKREEISELYKSGFSIEKLEKIYNVSDTVIRRVLKECDVEIRDNSHKSRKYTLNENYFDNIDSPNKAYILGLLFSDGCNYTKANNIKIELQERDKEILNMIKDKLQSNIPLKFNELSKKNINWQNTYRLTITNKHMSEQLSKLGMIPNKSLVLEFPKWLDESLYSHFIRGYLDGDGHIHWDKSKFITIASSKEFCLTLQEVLHNIGIKSQIYNTGNKDSNTKILGLTSKDNIKKFLDYVYQDADLYIQRKYDVYQTICKEI